MSDRRPNVIWIQADQFRADCISCLDGRAPKTPNLDALAQRGTIFTNAHCNSPVCLPSRMSQLSSRYPQEVNCLGNDVGYSSRVVPEETQTFPQVFADAGYRTVSFGRYHTTDHPVWQEMHDTNIYDVYGAGGRVEVGSIEGDLRLRHFRLPDTIIAGTLPENWFEPHAALNRHVLEYVKNATADEPYLMRIGYMYPHDPIIVPPPFDSMYSEGDFSHIPLCDEDLIKNRTYLVGSAEKVLCTYSREELVRHRLYYMGAISCLDNRIGELMDGLKEAGMYDNTIFMFSADHGHLLNEWGLLGKSVFDWQSWQVPLIFHGPGLVPEGKRYDDLCDLMDTGPTLLSLAGLEGCIPADYQGRDLFSSPGPDAIFGEIGWPLISREFAEMSGMAEGSGGHVRVGVRTRKHKMDLNWIIGDKLSPPGDYAGQLFDRANDPQERKNLFTLPQHSGVVDALVEKVSDWWQRINKPRALFPGIAG